MTTLRRLNIALAAAAALTAATWSLPASANGEKPGPTVSQKSADVTVQKKARRAAMRKRIAWAHRIRPPIRPAVQYTWLAPYERVAAHWPVLILGIGF
jgi:hypothetical protein